MSFQSWSSSYSYSNDGENEIYNYSTNQRDNKKEFNTGFHKNHSIKDNTINEMFYKNMDSNQENRMMMGKSFNNSDWNIRQQINGNLHKEFSQEYNSFSILDHIPSSQQPKQLEYIHNSSKLERFPNSLISPNSFISQNSLI